MNKYEDIINVTKDRLQKKFYSQDAIPADEDISYWLKKVLDLEDVESAYEEGTDDSTEFNADEEQANEI